jgi:ComF family protein
MAALVRRAALRDKWAVASLLHLARTGLDTLVNFALPSRCAGCATIVDEIDTFCPACWPMLQFLRGGCETCGIPLESTAAEQCAPCLAQPPVIDRTRSAMAYDDMSRQIALKLKYGRKVALARTMARYMAQLRSGQDDALIVPVPLHRRRLWGRGFNQAALISRHLSRSWALPVADRLLVRTRHTASLKGLSHGQRQRAVGGAFAVADPAQVAGRTVILVDDVLASGATSENCARVLKRAGAARVELVSWARVVRPGRFER